MPYIYLHLNFPFLFKKYWAKAQTIRNCVMIIIPNIYFLRCKQRKNLPSLFFSRVNVKHNTKIAQSNTLLINNITFNMVNNSRNALCILCLTPMSLVCAQSTRVTSDKQLNELLFIWFGCVCVYICLCILLKYETVVWMCRLSIAKNAENARGKRKDDQKIKTKWGKHVNRI